MADVASWRLSGDWFDVCRCRVPCGCTFAQAPDEGQCDGILAWHVREGHYGDVTLDGLNFVMVGSFEGNLWTGEAKNSAAGFFLDERADERQREALQTIFAGQVGGWPRRSPRSSKPTSAGLSSFATYSAARWGGVEPRIAGFLIGGLFIAPFILFSATSGQLADKLEKSWFIRRVKDAERIFAVVCRSGRTGRACGGQYQGNVDCEDRFSRSTFWR